jgi:hypothetical protein
LLVPKRLKLIVLAAYAILAIAVAARPSVAKQDGDGGHGGAPAPGSAEPMASASVRPAAAPARDGGKGADASTLDAGGIADAERVDDAAAPMPDGGEAGASASDAGTEGALDAGAEEAFAPLPPLPPLPPMQPFPPAAAETERPKPVPTEAQPALALKTIVALIALLVLAYAANHPRLRRLEELVGIRSAITAGFPFVALGLIARHPAIGVASENALVALTPLVEFGLGWLGFLVGFRLDLRRLDSLPSGAGRVIAFSTISASVAIACASGVSLLFFGFAQDGVFLRTGAILGVAGCMTAPLAIRAVAREGKREQVAEYLDEIVGVAGLWLIAAYFRPDGLAARWAIPGTAWLLMALGMGVMLGTLLHVILRRPSGDAEFMVIALGGVAFSAGLAAYVRLSPLVIGFVAGIVVMNLPTPRREALGLTLERIERPIFLVFLALAGALWDPTDVRGWVLTAVFVASRYVGLWVGRRLARQSHPETFAMLRPISALMEPISVVAIAVVVSARILYGGPTVSLVVTAVIGGALISEMLAALVERTKGPTKP